MTVPTIHSAAATLCLLFSAALFVSGCSEEHDSFYPNGAPTFGVSVAATPNSPARDDDTYFLWVTSQATSFSGAEIYSLAPGAEVVAGQGVAGDLDVRVDVIPGRTIYEWHEDEAEWHDEQAATRSVHVAVRLGASVATGEDAHALDFYPGPHGPDLEINGGATTAETVTTVTLEGIRHIANFDAATALPDNVDGTATGGATEPPLTGALHEIEAHLHMPEVSRNDDPLHTSETEMVRGEVKVTFIDIRVYQGRFVAWEEDLDANGVGLGTYSYQEVELEQTLTHLGAGIALPEHELTVELESGPAKKIYEDGYPAPAQLDPAVTGEDMSISITLHAADLDMGAGGGGAGHADDDHSWESQNLPGFTVQATILNELTNGSITVTLSPIWSEEWGLYYGGNVDLPLIGQVTEDPADAGGGGGGHGH